MTWPAPLRPGDRVALVAPCGVATATPPARTRSAWPTCAAVDDDALRAIGVLRGGSGATRLVGHAGAHRDHAEADDEATVDRVALPHGASVELDAGAGTLRVVASG